MSQRKIIHVDMDAFYASVEQLDNPDLIGKPIAVGGNRERGVIAAASYEARKFGVRSAMASVTAAKLCPELIFVKPNFKRYKEISKSIHEIFHRYTDVIEPLALDEAFLDVTENKIQMPSATFIAQSIKNDIQKEIGIIASAGVSYNKFLAKMASDQDKPNGLFVIGPEEGQAFIEQLSIERFFGVGKVMAEKMHELQIYKGKDLKRFSEENLKHYFGKAGMYLFNISRGIDDRKVINNHQRKSIAAESTLASSIFDNVSFQLEAERILKILWSRYDNFKKNGKTLSLKLKFDDFTVKSKSKTITEFIQTEKQLQLIAEELIVSQIPLPKSVRLIGFSISGFQDKVTWEQTSLEI